MTNVYGLTVSSRLLVIDREEACEGERRVSFSGFRVPMKSEKRLVKSEKRVGKKRFLHFLSRFFLSALVLLLPVSHVAWAEPEASANEAFRQLNLFGDVFERVRSLYVEEKTDEELIQSAIDGMLSKLDPHSSYLPVEDFAEVQDETRGTFGGLGIEVVMENGLVKVVAPIDETPAKRAGLLSGDLISHLDGKPVLGLSSDEAIKKMRGPIGEAITLTVIRENVDPFDVVIVRDTIRDISVRTRLEDDSIGYLRIRTFKGTTYELLEEEIQALQKEHGDKIIGYVLDLRDNPGGLLNQAIAVSDAFLDQGEIVSTRGRDGKNIQRFNAEPGDLIDGKPLMVLINGGSASASEIVAGALQDHGRAVVMGTRSFGKGSVQSIMELSDFGAIRLTTARYYTPAGTSIQARGIDPDIVVNYARLEEIKISRQREADLPGALVNGKRKTPGDKKPGDGTPESGKPSGKGKTDGEGKKPATTSGVETGKKEVKPVVDYQLERAKDMLTGLALFNKLKK